MRSTISALIVAAGLVGFAASAQAAPVAGSQLGIGQDAPIVHVQDRMMRRHMRHRMMRHRMERHMMHRQMRHRMMRHRMRHM